MRFRKRWIWPMFADPSIESEYTKYKMQMEKNSGYMSLIIYLSVVFLLLVNSLFTFKSAVSFIELDFVFQFGIILAIITLGLHVMLVLCVLFHHFDIIFVYLNPYRCSKMLLGPCVISLSSINAVFMLARCIHGPCREDETGLVT